MRIQHRFITALFLFSFVFLSSVFSQEEHENPNQKGVEAVVEPAPVSNVKANIVPLIWRVTIGEAVVSVPLRSIEYYGVQIYDTDSQTRVRELTICTESQSLIRIYYIQPLGTTNERLAEKAERLRQIAQGATEQEWSYPFKQYPTTTHTHMVEYRVGDKDSISQLFTHLESTMIEYHARDLTAEQRPQIMREIKVEK